jgi:osmotically-inducible protein OsmY
MKSLITFALGAAAGAAARHFLDASRRNQLRDQAMSKARSGAGQAASAATHVAAKAKGTAATAAPSGTKIEDVDDVTLARKVETEIFRDADVPKGSINVNAENGTVVLRGEVGSPEMIGDLVGKTRKVQGVQEVENLLHTPGEPAPTHE